MTHEEQERKIRDLEIRIDEMERKQREERLSQYKWGVRVLGAVVMAMGAWIWSQIGHLVSLNVGK